MTQPTVAGTRAQSRVFSPARLGPVTLRNHIIKAATFEGMTPRGQVTSELTAFHVEQARGGVAMTTLAYCAVSPEGRTDRHVLVLTDDAVPDLRRLTDAVHAEGAAACAQIGHAGLVANARSNRARGVAPSPRFSPSSQQRFRGATTADLARLTEAYTRAARVAVESGFDALEIHMGHHYLLNEFLSPKLNRRTDQYGGSLENRARFPREVARAVRDAVGRQVAVYAKYEMADGVRGGLELDDSVPMAQLLESDATLDALELTGGGSLLNPMYLFRGDVPFREFLATQPFLPRIGLRLMGRRFFRRYPFEEAFFLPMAREFRAALDMPLILLGGINRLDTMEAALDHGFDLVAMARALLREPDLPRRLEAGSATSAACIHCNRCMPTIYSGTHCPEIPIPAALPSRNA